MAGRPLQLTLFSLELGGLNSYLALNSAPKIEKLVRKMSVQRSTAASDNRFIGFMYDGCRAAERQWQDDRDLFGQTGHVHYPVPHMIMQLVGWLPHAKWFMKSVWLPGQRLP